MGTGHWWKIYASYWCLRKEILNTRIRTSKYAYDESTEPNCLLSWYTQLDQSPEKMPSQSVPWVFCTSSGFKVWLQIDSITYPRFVGKINIGYYIKMNTRVTQYIHDKNSYWLRRIYSLRWRNYGLYIIIVSCNPIPKISVVATLTSSNSAHTRFFPF